MPQRKSLDEQMKADVAEVEAAAERDPSWDEELQWSTESPEVDRSQLYEALNAPSTPAYERRTMEAEVRGEVTDSELVAELRASAGRAGVLSAPTSQLNGIIAQFAGTGVFAREGRLPRAMVVTVATTPAQLWDVRVDRPGYREASEQWSSFQPLESRPAARLRATLADLRASTDLAALVVVGQGCLGTLTWAELDAIAADFNATVVVVEDGPAAVWTARDAVEPARKHVRPTVVQVLDPELPPATAVSEREIKAITRELAAKGHPESVTTIDGHRLSVAYHSQNAAGIVNYVEYRGWAERDGHQEELEVESADGLRSPISKRQFRAA